MKEEYTELEVEVVIFEGDITTDETIGVPKGSQEYDGDDWA